MPILEINNVPIDINGEPISLNKQAYPIESWNERTLNHSDRVIIPETKIARELFSRPGNPEVKANKFGKYYPFKYKDLSTIIFSGQAILSSSNGTIEILLTDEAKEFFDNLNKKLNKLDFESDDFIFSVAEYDLKKIDNDSVWIWPAVAMHINKNVNNTILAGGGADAKLKYSRPMFSARKLRDKIYSTNKWSVSPCEQLNIVDSVCISANAKQFYVTSYQKTLTDIIVGSNPIIGLDTNDFNFGLTVNPTNLDIGTTNTKFRIRGSITATETSLLIVNGLSSPSGTDAQKQEFVINKGTFEYDLTTSDFTTSENSNIIDFSVITIGTVTFNSTLLYTIIEESDLGSFSGNNLIGYLVKVYDNMPDFKQKEFLKNCFTMFGAFFQTNQLKKELKANSYVTLSKLNSLDWSDKFIVDSENITGIIGRYGRTNYFSYDNDGTIPESTGRGEFQVNNETLEDIETIFTNIFSASTDVEIDGLDMASFDIYNDSERVNTLNDRILYYQVDGTRGITHATFNQISGDRLLEIYHKNIIESLYDVTVIECEFLLNRTDFLTFDFTKTVYIKAFKSTFLVLSINEYIEGRASKVKLLKYK